MDMRIVFLMSFIKSFFKVIVDLILELKRFFAFVIFKWKG